MSGSDGKHVCMLMQPPAWCAVPPTLRTTRHNMCRVRELWLPSARHHGAAAFVRSARRLSDERARCRGATCHPYSLAVFCWQCLHMAVTMAAFIYIPFQVFMLCPNPYDPLILFGDLMSSLNIVASFLTGYVDDDSKHIVLAPRAIAQHYAATYFLPDVIAVLPLQLIHLFDDCRYPSHTIMLILKLFRLPTLIKEGRSLLEQLDLSYVKKKVLTVILKVVLFFHWMTFIHYQVPCFTIHYFEEDERYKVWLKRFNVDNIEHNTMFQKYTANLFLVCGLCIGAGYDTPVTEHIISELLLTSLMGLVGLIFLIYAFASLLHLAICKEYETNLFNGKSTELNEYMNFKRLPKFLQRKIQLFINYKYNGHLFNEEVIMNTINEQIKQDINMYGCKKLVMTVPLFQDMPIALINAILFSLTKVLFMPGEILVKCGQPGHSLYMISSGTVAVMSSTGKEMTHLSDGSFFGDTELLNPGTKRVATIIALEITEIYKLDNKNFQTCLQPYPHLKRRLEDYLQRRFKSLRPGGGGGAMGEDGTGAGGGATPPRRISQAS